MIGQLYTDAIMFASRLFWKLFLTYTVLTLLTAVGFVFVVFQRQQLILEAQHQRRLHDLAVAVRESLAESIPQTSSPELQTRLKRLADATGTRISLIKADGEVVGDSADDPAGMDDHSNRPEIIEAEKKDVGLARRDSPTLETPMMYVAVPIESDGKTIGYARVAADMATIHAESQALQNRIYIAAALVSCIAVLLTYLIVSRIVQPLSVLTKAAQAIASGESMPSVHIPNLDEIGVLAGAFNSMSRQLAERITELQDKTRELEENSNRLSTVLAGMIEGVIAVDDSERILFANRAARPLLDLSTDEVIGRPIWEAIRNKTVHDVVRETLAGRQKHAVEFEVPRTQSVMAMLATRMPGKPSPGVVLVTHDVTELRKLENLRHEFVSNVSHELKTPLTAIQTFTETLLNGALSDPENARRFLQRIEEQAERLHMLILDLLSLAKIESGQEVFDVSRLAIDPLIASCVEEYRTVAEAKPIQLIAEPPGVDVQVEVESEGFRFIVNNLIDNAVKYTPAGGRVTVRWRAERTHAVIEVEDTGVGIAREHQERIFERFYRVDKARSREMGGTGLGLSIVKHLAQVFSGSVELKSQVGKGSTFTVRLPLA